MKRIFLLSATFMLFYCGALPAGLQPAARAQEAGARDIFAPEILILSPESSETIVTDSAFNLRAVVYSYKMPLLEVRVTLNGAVVLNEKYSEPSLTKKEFEMKLKLLSGVNLLSIVAANAKMASPAVNRLIIFKDGSGAISTQTRPNLIVLAVGVSKFKNSESNLRFSETNAEDLLKGFTTQSGGLFQNVKTKLLSGDALKRGDLIEGLNWMNSSVQSEDDVRVLILSGRSATDDDGDSYFLLPSYGAGEDLELNAVSYRVLSGKLSARPGRAVLFIESAYGGSSMERPNNFQQTLSQFGGGRSNNLTIFAASTGDGITIENPAWKHGAFTQAILDGLSGEADLNRDGVVDTKELAYWIDYRVERLTNKEQHPITLMPEGAAPLQLFNVKR